MTWSVGQVTLSYSLKYLRYQMIPLSISEFSYKINRTFTIMHYTFQQGATHDVVS